MTLARTSAKSEIKVARCCKQKTPLDSTSGARKSCSGLTLGELVAFARARLAVLLALLHARIARQQAVALERGAQVGVRHEQGAGDAVPHGAGLAGGSTAGHIHPRIKLTGRLGDGERLGDNATENLRGEVILQCAAVND